MKSILKGNFSFSACLLLCWILPCLCIGGEKKFIPASIELAKELFEEKDWKGCELESKRLITYEPSNVAAELLYAKSLAWQGIFETNIFLRIAENQSVHSSLRADAFYYMALIAYVKGEKREAFLMGKESFLLAGTDSVLFSSAYILEATQSKARGSYELSLLEQASRVLKLYNIDRNEIKSGINSFLNAQKNNKADKISSIAGNAFVSFYRKNIRPAIGDRCSLMPSCSEYTRQAFIKHGWIAIPMMADRFYREPEVVSRAEKTVQMNDGRILIADPLEDHDWYFIKD